MKFISKRGRNIEQLQQQKQTIVFDSHCYQSMLTSTAFGDIMNIHHLNQRSDTKVGLTTAKCLTQCINKKQSKVEKRNKTTAVRQQDKQEQDQIQGTSRPGLKKLQELNQQLEFEDQFQELLKRIEFLQEENSELTNTVRSLEKQLEVEKKLRKYVQSSNKSNILMEPKEMTEVSAKLKRMKQKYQKNKKSKY